jgi:TetR/AcrR family transcriptional regulator, transcriptional repressor for nem operon
LEDSEKMRYPAEETAAKHDRIVKEASRLFRERGFDDVTVDEVMKAAGLTHGAFYAHFGSKEELEEAAVAYGQTLSASRARSYGATKKGRRDFADRYLSARHRDNPGDGGTRSKALDGSAVFEESFHGVLRIGVSHGGQESTLPI